MVALESWHPKHYRSCSKVIQTKLYIGWKWWQTLSYNFHYTQRRVFLLAFLGSKTWFTCFQMWSTRVDSESPNLCNHFDTKIEVVTIKIIRARFLSTPWTRSVLQSVESLIFCFFWNTLALRASRGVHNNWFHHFSSCQGY